MLFKEGFVTIVKWVTKVRFKEQRHVIFVLKAIERVYHQWRAVPKTLSFVMRTSALIKKANLTVVEKPHTKKRSVNVKWLKMFTCAYARTNKWIPLHFAKFVCLDSVQIALIHVFLANAGLWEWRQCAPMHQLEYVKSPRIQVCHRVYVMVWRKRTKHTVRNVLIIECH